MTRVPSEQAALAETYMANARRIYLAMTGVTTLAALEQAEAIAKSQPTKAELQLAIRAVQAEARRMARPIPARRADPFAVPAIGAA